MKELIHDPFMLSLKSEDAGAEDIQTAEELADTLRANRERCVGMAANMIGVRKRIIAFYDGKELITMFNPEIIKAEKPYDTEEGCLSLLGGPRPVKRFEKIKVRWQNERMQTRVKNFSGFAAQIIQHETDHCNGILI
ncbi:MAG: peptide deformylase [Oscillospiraceae bacterium]|nr:peptide deformylase [Oscillospiraceae bacterium]